MSLLQTIKTAQLQARKERLTTTAGLLTTLVGEATAVGKNNGNRETTDAEVVAVIKKFVNNITETIAVLEAQPESTARNDAIGKAKTELYVLNFYLPKQLSEDELRAAVDAVIASSGASSIKDMGRVMQSLKDAHGGTYDGGAASKIVRERLSQLTV
jgi:uncharacterized protein YqeY